MKQQQKVTQEYILTQEEARSIASDLSDLPHGERLDESEEFMEMIFPTTKEKEEPQETIPTEEEE